MKALLWYGILVVFAASARAENFYSALMCRAGETFLQVQNENSEPQAFWLQNLGSHPFTESYIEVKAHGRLSLPLSEYYQENETAVAVKTPGDALTFKAFCKTKQKTWFFETGISPWKKIAVPLQSTEVQLHFANLSHQTNSLEISFESLGGQRSSQTVILSEEFKTHSIALKLPFATTSMNLRAQGRWTGKAADSKGQELFLKDETVVLSKVPQTRYFLFESQNYDSSESSFVVPLDSPKLIAESLDQIAHPERARLLVARIEKSQTGLNRDFTSAVKAPWSWQVMEALNYADFAHISCDGSPALVEERLNSWLSDTGGTICFWSYRVVRELTLQELAQSSPFKEPRSSLSSSHPALKSLQRKH